MPVEAEWAVRKPWRNWLLGWRPGAPAKFWVVVPRYRPCALWLLEGGVVLFCKFVADESLGEGSFLDHYPGLL